MPYLIKTRFKPVMKANHDLCIKIRLQTRRSWVPQCKNSKY